MRKPTIWQRIRYYLGLRLPPELHEWVRRDLIGRGANERYLLRFAIPTLVLFALVFLLPGPASLKIGLLIMMVVPMLVFTAALSYVWRRFRMVQHGMDPDRVNRAKFSDSERRKYYLHYRHS